MNIEFLLSFPLFGGSRCLPSKEISLYRGLSSIKQFATEPVDFVVGVLATGVLLFVLASRLFLTERARNTDATFMRYLVALYSISTGVFASILAIWNAGKLLLITAATHNLLEWGIIWYLLLPKPKAEKFWTGSIFWIWFVITVVAILPNMVYSFIFEQSFGLVCDYLLAGIFTIYCFKQPQYGNIWKYGLLGSIFHFGQIWSLIIGSFGVGGKIPFVLEWLLVFTSLPTFWFYGDFALQWDEKVAQEKTRAPNSVHPHPNKVFLETWKIVGLFLVSIFLSLGTILGPPLVLGVCPGSVLTPPNHFCYSKEVVGYTTITAKPRVADAVEQILQPLIPQSRNETGNVLYNLARGVDDNDDKFFIVESWDSMDSLQNHLKSHHVRSIFGDPAFRAMLTEVQKHGPWKRIEPCYVVQPPALHVGFIFSLNASRDTIWKLLSDISDCRWVKNCLFAEVSSPSRRRLVMKEGTFLDEVMTLDSEYHLMQYKILNPTPLFENYQATVLLRSINANQTDVTYTASFNAAASLNPQRARSVINADLQERLLNWLPKQFTDGKFVPS